MTCAERFWLSDSVVLGAPRMSIRWARGNKVTPAGRRMSPRILVACMMTLRGPAVGAGAASELLLRC